MKPETVLIFSDSYGSHHPHFLHESAKWSNVPTLNLMMSYVVSFLLVTTKLFPEVLVKLPSWACWLTLFPRVYEDDIIMWFCQVCVWALFKNRSIETPIVKLSTVTSSPLSHLWHATHRRYPQASICFFKFRFLCHDFLATNRLHVLK